MQSHVDNGHLTTIAVCHYLWGGLVMVFSSIFIVHIVLGVINGTMPNPPNQPQMPPQMGYLFVAMGAAAVFIDWSVGTLTIFSGRAITQRKWRVFGLVMAGVNCASFPVGTVLGAFTFVVLLRPSVRGQYSLYSSLIEKEAAAWHGDRDIAHLIGSPPRTSRL